VRWQATGLAFVVRGVSFGSGLQRAPPEYGVGPCAVLLRDAVSNLMTQGQVHLISNSQSQAQGCQRVGLSDSNLALLESPGQSKLGTPLRNLGVGKDNQSGRCRTLVGGAENYG
jgi:hypothetical protein